MSKNKVGIITIYSVYNYGAMLQAYALQHFLASNKVESEIISYKPYDICKAYDFYWKDLIYRPRNALSLLKQKILSSKKFYRFRAFHNQYLVRSSTIYRNGSELKSSSYNTIITGSDQIWNPNITNQDTNFLAAFANDNVKKIAYSSSFGVSQIDANWSDKVAINLSKFDTLALREDTGIDIVEKLVPTKKKHLVLDPVFLLDREFWDEFVQKANIYTEDKYLLVYSLEVSKKIIEQSIAISREHNLKIITVHPFRSDYDFADICINDAGPIEFVNLIRNAEYVLTNSFHGTAYSIIFNKKLVCEPHSMTGTRMLSLLKRFDVKQTREIVSNKEIYVYSLNEASLDLLEKNRIFSMETLLNSLSVVHE